MSIFSIFTPRFCYFPTNNARIAAGHILKPLINTLLWLILAAPAGATGAQIIVEPVRTSSVSGSSVNTGVFEGQHKPLSNGVWGGKHVQMEVSDNSARIEFDCAHATSPKIVPDSRGRFAVRGTYFKEHGGPTRQDEEENHQVVLRGTIRGKSMQLTVTVAATKEVIGTFTLTHGAESELVKCR